MKADPDTPNWLSFQRSTLLIGWK